MRRTPKKITGKKQPVSSNIDPALYQDIKSRAELESRPLANLLEILIRLGWKQYGSNNGKFPLFFDPLPKNARQSVP